MNGLFLWALALPLGFIVPTPVFAEDAAPAPKTEIVTDAENSTVRVVIDGKTVGVFDKDGFTVYGDIKYTGVMTDIGDAAPPENDEKQEGGR